MLFTIVGMAQASTSLVALLSTLLLLIFRHALGDRSELQFDRVAHAELVGGRHDHYASAAGPLFRSTPGEIKEYEIMLMADTVGQTSGDFWWAHDVANPSGASLLKVYKKSSSLHSRLRAYRHDRYTVEGYCLAMSLYNNRKMYQSTYKWTVQPWVTGFGDGSDTLGTIKQLSVGGDWEVNVGYLAALYAPWRTETEYRTMGCKVEPMPAMYVGKKTEQDFTFSADGEEVVWMQGAQYNGSRDGHKVQVNVKGGLHHDYNLEFLLLAAIGVATAGEVPQP